MKIVKDFVFNLSRQERPIERSKELRIKVEVKERRCSVEDMIATATIAGRARILLGLQHTTFELHLISLAIILYEQRPNVLISLILYIHEVTAQQASFFD